MQRGGKRAQPPLEAPSVLPEDPHHAPAVLPITGLSEERERELGVLPSFPPSGPCQSGESLPGRRAW